MKSWKIQKHEWNFYDNLHLFNSFWIAKKYSMKKLSRIRLRMRVEFVSEQKNIAALIQHAVICSRWWKIRKHKWNSTIMYIFFVQNNFVSLDCKEIIEGLADNRNWHRIDNCARSKWKIWNLHEIEMRMNYQRTGWQQKSTKQYLSQPTTKIIRFKGKTSVISQGWPSPATNTWWQCPLKSQIYMIENYQKKKWYK